MNFNIENISDEAFQKELNKIPEPYRTRLLSLVNQAQEKLEQGEYYGDAGAGLVKITVDQKGALNKIEIDKTLLQESISSDDKANLISDLSSIAHKNAISSVQDAVNKELSALYAEIIEITKELMASD